jgi:outer membrane biosynthesis protein TonB
MQSVFDAAGCDSARASTRASGGGGGTLTFRPNGTVASVALLDMGASRECNTAVRALLATYVADQAEMNQSRQVPPYATVIPFQPDFVGCQNGQTPASAMPGGTPPKKIKDVKPSFPASAQRDRVGGLTVLEVEISEAGCIRRLTVLRSQDERLAWASIRAVSGWLFTSMNVDGRPAPVRMTVTTNFTPN